MGFVRRLLQVQAPPHRVALPFIFHLSSFGASNTSLCAQKRMQFCAKLLKISTVADSFSQKLGVARHRPDQGKCHGTRRRPLQSPPRRHVNTQKSSKSRARANECARRTTSSNSPGHPVESSNSQNLFTAHRTPRTAHRTKPNSGPQITHACILRCRGAVKFLKGAWKGCFNECTDKLACDEIFRCVLFSFARSLHLRCRFLIGNSYRDSQGGLLARLCACG